MTGPALSVVVAVGRNEGGSYRCLDALAPQCDATTEILIVASYREPTDFASQFPGCTWVLSSGTLIPHLWRDGMLRARGTIIAITTWQFVPRENWVATLLAAHARCDTAAVGGRIDPPDHQGLVAWATYFMRYSQYLELQTECDVDDIAGDNASYNRSALQAHRDVWQDGFWEPFYHQCLLIDGEHLRFVPEIAVTLNESIGFKAFLLQRLHHGMQFGSARAMRRGRIGRILFIAASPLIPLVFGTKILGRVIRSGRYIGRFVAASPVLVCFLVAWSAGEVWGNLSSSVRPWKSIG